MRLFCGIALPKDVTANLSRLLDHLRPAAHLRWSAAYNLHITTKFIGEWPESRLDELKAALEPLGARRPPIHICIRGMGWIPNPHSPRILFAAVDAEPALAELAQDTEDVCARFGIERETRPFKPHLTLARIKDPTVSLAALRQSVAQVPSTEFGCFDAECFHLFLSKLGPAGSIYTQLAEVRFTGA